MLEYRRSYRAEKQRAHDLEAQQRILEASVQAVEVCWTQVSLSALTSTGGGALAKASLARQCCSWYGRYQAGNSRQGRIRA